MPTIVATPGAANANSYLTLAEAQTYWASRLFTDSWDNSDDQNAALIWATRTIDALLSGYSEYVVVNNVPMIHTYPAWTGAAASSTQALAWPRTGMLDRNGNAIASTVVPQALKDAVSELAGQMSKQDRTIDNDVAVQGITAVRAGSVSVNFDLKGVQVLKTLPDYVVFLLVPSWMTNDKMVSAMPAEFDIIS